MLYIYTRLGYGITERSSLNKKKERIVICRALGEWIEGRIEMEGWRSRGEALLRNGRMEGGMKMEER